MEQVFNFDNVFKKENENSLFFLKKCLVNLANGNVITDATASRKIVHSFNELFSPTLIDYTFLDRLKDKKAIANAVTTKPVLNPNKYIDEEVLKGFEFNNQYLNNLTQLNSPEKQTEYIFELINTYFHEVGHVEDFLKSKNEYSLQALDSALSTIVTHRNLSHYKNNYLQDTNECSARFKADNYTRQIIARFLPMVQDQANDGEALDKFTSICNTQLQERKLNMDANSVYSHFPIVENGINYPRITYDTLLCKNIISENPELVNQFNVLRLKYNPDGSERSLLTLLKERELTLTNLSSDPTQLNNATCFYNGLIYQKLLSSFVEKSTSSELSNVFTKFGKTGVDAVMDHAKTYATDWTNDFTEKQLSLAINIKSVKDNPSDYEEKIVNNLLFFEDLSRSANEFINDKDQQTAISTPYNQPTQFNCPSFSL